MIKMSEIKKTELTVKDSIKIYLKGVRTEWDKVTWPEKKQVVVETLVVIGVVIFFTAMVFFYDIIFEYLFKLMPGG